jgi:hypothetical protein
VTADSLDRDSEAWELMMRLVMGHSENARLDASALLDAGFEVVQVRGLPDVLWKQNGGPHDGALFTTDAAIRVVEPPETIPDPRDG